MKYIHDNYPDQYVIDTIDMVDGTWREKSFAGYDSVFHVAGIAHSDSGRISTEKKELYYAINTNMAVETAKKAKSDGVKQFIFMSSAIVYGDSAPIGKIKLITLQTPLAPSNCYGDSKAQAEKKLSCLDSDDFKIVILRPPMIYGKGSKGNYPVLVKISLKMPFFPYIRNERSMLYINNLCEFVRLMIQDEEKGVFWPQNGEYSNTSELVKMIAEAHGKRIVLIRGCAWAMKLLSHMTGLVNKAFGSFAYDLNMSTYKKDYRVANLAESVKETETI